MTNAQLQKRIEQLEQQVRDLQARPMYVPQPVFIPLPAPQPYLTWFTPLKVTCVAS